MSDLPTGGGAPAAPATPSAAPSAAPSSPQPGDGAAAAAASAQSAGAQSAGAPSGGVTAAEGTPTAAPSPSLLDGAAPAAPTTVEGGDAADAAAGPPETYDLKAPEGQALDVKAVEAFTPIAKELGLSNAQAQRLTDFYAAQGKAQAEASGQRVAALHADWTAKVKADPDIGGAKLDASMVEAGRALDAFGGVDLRRALTVTGAGNHPAIVRAFVQIGRAMGSDGFVLGGSGRTAPRDHAERLYGNT